MKVALPIFALIAIITSSCSNSFERISYASNDTEIRIDSNSLPGYVLRYFERGGMRFFDTLQSNKIVSRKAYYGDLLMYKYPIAQEDIKPLKMRIKGDKDRLTLNKPDTITILNSLPPKNQSLYTKGAEFNRLSSFRIVITPTNPAVDTVWLFIQGRQVYAEITDKTVYKDSIAIPVII